LVATFVELLDPFNHFIACNRNRKGQQGFEQGDGRDRWREELRCIRSDNKAAICRQDDRTAELSERPTTVRPCWRASVTVSTASWRYGWQVIEIGMSRSSAQARIIDGCRSRPGNGVEIDHVGRGQIVEIAGVGIVAADVQSAETKKYLRSI